MLKQQDRAPKRPDTMEFHSLAIQRVISAIREHLDESISLGKMAAVAYMSPYHFNRTFRRITGLPPRRFLSALRFEAATKKLLETDSSITDICLDVGYSSLGTFVRRFSDALGISPKQMRRLRESPTNNLLKPLEKHSDNSTGNARPSVTGRIAGSFFEGPIFVGLFAGPIPEGAPVACTVLFRPDNFVITGVPAGRYYVYALGLPWPQHMDDYFRYESALRGGGETVTVSGSTVACADIQLRAPLDTDPPIVLNLPVLLERASLFGLNSETSALTEQGFAGKGKVEVKHWRRHTMEEKRQAVERMKTCGNITALAHEYGIQRKLLYVWKQKIEGRPAIMRETYVPKRTETVLRAG
jgi:AraC-like DNA-binding protein